ncbi:hypothetical protein AGLY_000217 [Aphis glycines]|uniref:Gustatory receptor n=1 Tax=Aphis glycines TaxID=307491 RepID=A0A6G0U6C5_APHGL|nr:hypothetical protein AGLY_000217 [Aphis glycines]
MSIELTFIIPGNTILSKLMGLMNISYTMNSDDSSLYYSFLEFMRMFVLIICTYSIHTNGIYYIKQFHLLKFWTVLILARVSEKRIIGMINGIIKYDEKQKIQLPPAYNVCMHFHHIQLLLIILNSIPNNLSTFEIVILMEKIRLLHAELSQLLKKFSLSYGPLFLGYFVFSFIDMIYLLYLMINHEFNSKASITEFIITHTPFMMSIIVAASWINEKKKKIITYLRLTQISKLPTEVKTQIKLFMNQISVSGMDEITEFGIFNINLNLVVSLLMLLMTTCATLIQMKNHPTILTIVNNTLSYYKMLSDECISFTMKSKVRGFKQFSKSLRKPIKKMRKTGMFFTQNQFSTKSIFYIVVNKNESIITSRNNASISNFGGGFRWKSEYPWCIIETIEIFNFSNSNLYEICQNCENLQNLNFGVFRPLKHKPPFSPTTGNYILG